MSNDAKIRQYTKQIEEKRNNLGPKPKVAYKTNALIELDGGKINLNTLTRESQCVEIAGQLLVEGDIIDRGNAALGASVPCTYGDFDITDWLNDLKQRRDVIVWEAKKKQLTALESKLKSLLSDDAKTADAIADIAALLDE